MAETGWAGVKLKTTRKAGRINAKYLLSCLFSLPFVFLRVPVAAACPMCSDLLERGREAFQIFSFSKGISWSILVMLGAPFCMVGGFTYVIVRAARRSAQLKKELHHG